MDIAVLWKLPVIFVCENNGFSECSPSDTVTSGRIVDEARDMGSAASHIAALCADQCFETLKAPVKRVTVPDVALPYSPPLEKVIIPNEARITSTLKMPRVSMNMEEGTLVTWRKQPGDSFAEGDILYEIETEKVTSEFEAPCPGEMLEHLVEEGDDVPVGDDVCRIDKKE